MKGKNIVVLKEILLLLVPNTFHLQILEHLTGSQQELSMPCSRNQELKRTERKNNLATLPTVLWWSTDKPGPLTVFKNVQSHCFLKEEGRFGHRKVQKT